MGAYSQLRLRVCCLWRLYLGACPGVCLRASCELTWVCTVKQAASMPSTAIGSVFESVLGSVLASILWTYLGAYSQAGWECIWECAWECAWERLESLLGSVQSSRLEVCHPVQLGVYLRAYSGVCLRASSELGSVQWSAFGSFVECSMMYSIERT